MKPMLLRLHRWISLVFALPLLAIIATGLILSFEPLMQASGIRPQTLNADRVVEIVRRADPEGKARGIMINSMSQTLRLQGAGAGDIDLVTGQTVTGGSIQADLFLWSRRTHERLLDQAWLVTASTIAMLVIMTLGIAMGWPRLRNTLSGWHKGAAWFTLPLLILSPLTGLCLAFGLTFQSGGPPPGGGGQRVALPDAIGMVAQSHDLSQVLSIGVRGGRMMARIMVDGGLRSYAIRPDGLTELPRNWPRLLHEGNWSALAGSTLNVITSVVLLGLLATGVLLWGRRKLRRPQRRGEARRAELGNAA